MRDVDAAVRTAPAVVEELDLAAMRRALWRRKWWVVLPTLLAAGLAFVAVNIATPKYRSEARLLIEGRENVFLRPEAERSADRERTVDQEAVTSQVQLVLSRDLARQVIKRLKLGERSEFDPVLSGLSPLKQMLVLAGLAKDPLKMSAEERTLEAYYQRLSAYQVEKSRVIAIEFTSTDAELAARAANAIAEAYLDLQQTARQDQTRVASQWLGSEIENLRKRVAEAEARVEEFRARSNLFVGPNNTALSQQQLGELNSQLALARSQKADAEAKARLIRDMLRSGQPIESAEIVNSELIRRLSEQGAILRAQLAEQSSTLLDNHPRIKELKAQIADLDRQIRREAEKLVRSFENDARIAGARVESLSTSLDQLKRLSAASSEQDVQLRALEREAKAQRDLLEAYLAKYREATARDSLTAAPAEARIISRAAVSNAPYYPKKLPIIALATLSMLVLAIALVAAGALMSGSARQPLAAAPAAAPAAPAPPARPLAAAARPAAVGREPIPAAVGAMPPGARRTDVATAHDAIRALANDLRHGEGERSRIAVVGVARNVGTTSTAIALSRALAADGKTVLVDLALAAPGVAAISRQPGAPGLAELMRGKVSFRHIITRDRQSRLHLIGAGRVAADVADMVASDRLAIAVNALSRTYDHVVIDAGALPEIASARLAALASRAVLVAPATSANGIEAARSGLVGAGFATVTVFADRPPSPDEADTGPRTAAA